MKKIQVIINSLFLVIATSAFAGTSFELGAQPSPTPEDQNSHDLFATETTYTFNSDFRRAPKLGDGESLYDDFSYDHRFLIQGNWYFRAGVEYERFDFGGTPNGLPNHLQASYGHLAIEYIVHDHAGAGLVLMPGAYFENRVTKDAIDVPFKLFVTFPLKKDKIFAVIGVGGGLYYHPVVTPGGGLIWLFSDKCRLEGVFPKPALVYNPNDDWEFRVLGDILYDSFRTDEVFTTEKKIQLNNAVLEYTEMRGGAQVTYSGFKPFEITAGGGYTFRREFDFFRADRRAYNEPAPYVKLAVEAKF
jgi:hypothetical protein